MKGYKPVNLILMGNTLRFQNRADISRVYDLKGSTFNRFTKWHSAQKATTTLKDVNFLHNQHDFQEVNLSNMRVRKLNHIIKRDSEFLASLNIMDYSLLLGIENRLSVSDSGIKVLQSGRLASFRQDKTEMLHFKRHIFVSPDGEQTFYLSIIDFLQTWNSLKKAEKFAKTTFQRAPSDQLSSVEPMLYKQRFQ
jgi:1-phosphatidylinositol-5-phosphate 4-kinase